MITPSIPREEEPEPEQHEIRDVLGNTMGPSLPPSPVRQHHVNINDLPIELLIQIFSQLDPIYLNTIRLVCKKWDYAINDKETWTKSFNLKFNTPKIFPSLTNSINWMSEYFARLNILKNWKRGKSLHQFYRLINNEYRFNDMTISDFKSDRIMIFSKRHGNITSGNLMNGKNQSFIPGGTNLNILCSDMNYNYLVMGKLDGEIHLRDLNKSTSVSNRVSSLKFPERENGPIMSIVMNDTPDIFRNKVDVISGGYNGNVKCWTLNGNLVKSFEFGEIVYNIKSDFNKFILLNTENDIYVINYQTLEVIKRIPMGNITIENAEDPNTAHYYDALIYQKNFFDVDYASHSIIISHLSVIKVFNFETERERQLILPDDTIIMKSQMQTVRPSKIYNRNPSIIGKDGLLYANLLSDDSVIIWNIREDSKDIEPIVKIHPDLQHIKYSISIYEAINRRALPQVTTIALNGCIIAIGGYNGVTNIYDVFSGKFLREISMKFPKRFTHTYNELIPINFIKLNPNQIDTNGIIVCGDTIQYFQFGDLQEIKSSGSNKKAKLVNMGVLGKNESKRKIREGRAEYDSEEYTKSKTYGLLDKYNGTQFDDEDDELTMALAISESYHSSKDTSQVSVDHEENIVNGGSIEEEELDEELLLAIELSKQEAGLQTEEEEEEYSLYSAEPIESSSSQRELIDHEIDEDIRRALELSLIEK
ncbi:uncharacterized protein J8A68_005701 [[Candida] subhashii]|uniref:F-box domain-containing protein n=1 Tax=[Candida] subhashii TaxID=561895 RepID=A0A8J5UUW6_9ASCO|nr:uncharacterized protein J8A68_005701 [[Candida] subhashii]KAG7660739.1 hypothetical protein J8A68_005701 [[Candida] subhashii]